MATGVLFDLDGVLVDSESIYSEFWDNINCIYPTGIENFAYVIKGNNLQKILTTYFPDSKIQERILQRIHDFEDVMKYRLFDGVIEFLNELRDAGIPMAVVTSSDYRKMDKLYEQHPYFKGYFKTIITGDMVSQSKPNPECFLTGAEKIGIDICDCYIFEDSPSGIQAGLSSGAKVIALATTLHRCDICYDVHKILDSFIGFHVSDMLNV